MIESLNEFITRKFGGNRTHAAKYFTDHNTKGGVIYRETVQRWLKDNYIVLNETVILQVKLELKSS